MESFLTSYEHTSLAVSRSLPQNVTEMGGNTTNTESIINVQPAVRTLSPSSLFTSIQMYDPSLSLLSLLFTFQRFDQRTPRDAEQLVTKLDGKLWFLLKQPITVHSICLQ
jgi:hypothetical protein